MSAKNRKKDKNLYEKRRVEDLKAQKKAAPDSAQSTGGMKQFNFLFSESLVTFRRMVESVKSGIFVADLNGILLYANPAFVHLLGYNTRTDTQRMNLIH
ncbi:MAG: PAS domain-containing protein, partial [Candidatus Omnitrophica bacterium]|nr:PAS domain-containing protein [Candidatus Omnitrophota bacterium]